MPAPAAKSNGRNLTLPALAEAKRLPADFLGELGLHDLPQRGVGIPYYGPTGEEIAVKQRTAPKATEGSYWPKGMPLAAYGQWRLDGARQKGFLILVEGESDCWALWHHNLPALGLPGANTAKTLLREHVEAVETIYVHREPDRSGTAFVQGVRERLAALGFTGKVFELRMPEGVKDPADLHATDPERFLARLQSAITASTPLPLRTPPAPKAEARRTPSKKPSRPVAYIPFPVDVLPEPCRRFVVEGAAAIGCDPAFVALPLLAALASAIGNARRVELKRSWTEPAVVWDAIVGDSGTLKSPALDLALQSVRERQSAALRVWREKLATYEAARKDYEDALTEWRRNKRRGPKPQEPDGAEPVCARCLCSDITVESLALLLQDAPRGLLLARDELAGWVGGFDQYKAKGKGGDVAHWLEMHRAGQLIVDRKSGPVKLVHVPRAAVSITGGIQPETLRRALGREHFEDGLAARLLLAMPPARERRWSEVEVDPALETAVEKVFGRLYSLEMAKDGEGEGEPRPVALRLTPEGKAAWVRFFEGHARQHVDLTGDLAACWSKLEGYAARLALILECARWAATGQPPGGPPAVDAQSVEAGATLSRWFGQEARRVYGVLAEGDEDRERRRLLEWVQRKGGTVTPRDLQMGDRRYRDSAEAAEQALGELVEAGVGRWMEAGPTDRGGRPPRSFQLVNAVNVNETPRKPDGFGGFVDVDTVDGAESATTEDVYEGEL
jgi:hypothetical protein